MLLRLVAAAAVVLAVAGCGGTKKAAPKSALPPGCTVPEVQAIVTDFLDHPTLAPAEQFEIYASYESDGRKAVFRTRAPALAYLHRRKALGEVSRLIQLTVGKGDFNHARITFQLTRHAPDYVARRIHSRLVRGGGTIDCAHGLVAAWVTKGP